MNAYELAEIMEIHDGSLVWEHGLDIANMLRQQADRIAELEKDLEGCEYFLDKQQSAEPVAWTKKDTLIFLGNYEFGSITIQVQKQKDNEFDIPLYTKPQIKDLSDEEIDEVLYSMDWAHDPVKFARAILKKASEK